VNGRGNLRNFVPGLDKRFNFSTITHSAITEGVRLGVYQTRPAVGFVRAAPIDLGGHSECGFDGHADLERSGGDKEKATPREVEDLGEMLALVGG